MSEIRGIVLPHDGSQVASRAVPVARDLALRTGAEITLVTSDHQTGGGATAHQLDEVERELDGIVVHRIRMNDRGAASAVIDVTLAGEHRVLCMSSHGRGGIRRGLLGSVTTEVVRSGDVPVLVVGPGATPPTRSDDPARSCCASTARSAPGSSWPPVSTGPVTSTGTSPCRWRSIPSMP